MAHLEVLQLSVLSLLSDFQRRAYRRELGEQHKTSLLDSGSLTGDVRALLGKNKHFLQKTESLTILVLQEISTKVEA